VADEALESLPQRFKQLINNVAITIEDEPTDEDLESADDDEVGELLGIYRGVALTERTHDDPILPDEIVLFRGPLERSTSSRAELIGEIRQTVIHELGHYFGLGDEEMPY
jgi:predicted Zn-dependent protease with MMP-like domain